MFRDGSAFYYLIQHKESTGRWVGSALPHMLFNELPYEDSQGDLGNHYRKLIAPQSASSKLWQKYGIHGYTKLADAQAMLAAVRERRPEQEFRIVYRISSQTTIVQED
jgi:hypothetical protein